ncbi:DNA invertase Pin-like site-specific DNA recombinase [Streptomyces sp. 846.5]|nr:recombinase family protein [Streptomyces sp. 846.5]TDU05850.1 DNA invertase Pin-like site-specific DNA recombinase [Streptomyces sp. 846.5]
MGLRETPRRAGGRTELNIDPEQLSWVLYARESEDAEGAGEQVTNQMDDLREYATEFGGRVGREAVENDTSAFKKKRVRLPDGTHAYRVVRPVWDAVMTDLRRGTHNALALVNIDRGMRDPRDLEDLIDLVERYGVFVAAITGFLDLTTDSGIAMARNEINQRNLESRNTSRRMMNGKRKAALKGRNSGGAYRPFGWNEDKTTLNEVEADLLRKAADQVVSGVRVASIVKAWNAAGILSVTGKQWTTQTLSQILTNPRLYGVRTYKGEILLNSDGLPVRGAWEAILTEDQFSAVDSRVTSYGPRVNPRDGRGHVSKYLLSPFVRCGACGARMRGGTRPGPGGVKVHVYWCRSKEEGGCGGCSRLGSSVDEYITELVIQDHERASLKSIEELPPWGKEEALRSVRTKINELTQQYRADRITGGRYFPLLEELESDERALLAERRKYDSARESRMSAVTDLRERWADEKFLLEQRQGAVAESLIAVEIHPAGAGSKIFDPSKITPIWRDHDAESNDDQGPISKP